MRGRQHPALVEDGAAADVAAFDSERHLAATLRLKERIAKYGYISAKIIDCNILLLET